MWYTFTHVAMHLLVYLFWRYLAYSYLKKKVTINKQITRKGNILILLILAGIPYALAALLIQSSGLTIPFEGARFLATFSYLIHSRVFLQHLKKDLEANM